MTDIKYCINYNEEYEKFYLDLGETNMNDEVKYSGIINADSLQFLINDYNKRLKSNEIRVVKCKDCDKYFIVGLSEDSWYKLKGLQSPKRCQLCRHKRKNV